MTSPKLLKFFFDLNIDTPTDLCLPRGPSVPQHNFCFPFPALSILDIESSLLSLPLEKLKVVIRAYLEHGLRGIGLSGIYLSDTEMKDLVAYLRTLLTSLAPSATVSENRPFKITSILYGRKC